MPRSDRPARVWAMVAALLLLAGCAANPKPPQDRTTALPGSERDPWEGYNRRMYAFNDTLDQAFIKPLARGYHLLTPDLVEQGIGNFFANLGDVKVVVNDLLQAKFAQAAADTGRVLVNTTVGIGGLIDVASMIGLEKHDEDFGQTLGIWGVPSGPYIILPALGPSTLRDAPAAAVDRYTLPWPYLNLTTAEQRGIDLTQGLDLRVGLMAIEKTIDEMAFDRYATIRDSYLDRRRNQVYDGRPPTAAGGFDPIKELEMLEELEMLD